MTSIATKFERRFEEILAGEIKSYAAEGVEKANVALNAFHEYVQSSGAFQAMRWKGEELLAAELVKDLGAVMVRTMEEGLTPEQAHTTAEGYLQRQIEEGVDSTWSGLMTNEAAKARGKAALDVKRRDFSYMKSAARHQAMQEVAPTGPIFAAKKVVAELETKLSRAKADGSRLKITHELVAAVESLKQARIVWEHAARSCGVPDEMIDNRP